MTTIRWGIIGCGDVTEVKSGPGFQRARGSALVAVMRRNVALAEDYARRHGVPRWYGDAQALIDDPEVDAVYVATPVQPKRYRFPTHINDLVMDRAEAATSEVFIVEMAPGEAPPRHRHDDMEQIFYVLTGQGRLEIGDPAESFVINPGDVVRIPVSTWHTIHCLGNQALRYLAVDCFIAGRPAAEPTWDDHVRVVCQEQGWSYDAMRGH